MIESLLWQQRSNFPVQSTTGEPVSTFNKATCLWWAIVRKMQKGLTSPSMLHEFAADDGINFHPVDHRYYYSRCNFRLSSAETSSGAVLTLGLSPCENPRFWGRLFSYFKCLDCSWADNSLRIYHFHIRVCCLHCRGDKEAGMFGNRSVRRIEFHSCRMSLLFMFESIAAFLILSLARSDQKFMKWEVKVRMMSE